MKTPLLIKTARLNRGHTQKSLSNLLGYPNPQFISLVENGHSKPPVDLCNKLVKILKIKKSVMQDSLVSDYATEIKKEFSSGR